MPQALKELVPGIVQKLGVTQEGFEVVSLVESEIHKIAPRSGVAAYKNNKIYVEVESSTHLFELSMRRREILKSLQALPRTTPPEIKFFLKGFARPSAAERIKSSLKFSNEKIPKERK